MVKAAVFVTAATTERQAQHREQTTESRVLNRQIQDLQCFPVSHFKEHVMQTPLAVIPSSSVLFVILIVKIDQACFCCIEAH